MKKKIIILIFLLIGNIPTWGQNIEDSITFHALPNWRIICDEPNFTIKQFRSKVKKGQTHLFGSPQSIYIMEFNPDFFQIELIQTGKKQTVGDFIKPYDNVIGAINGGFFTKIPISKDSIIANDFLKINGEIHSPIPSPGWGTGAVGFDENSRPIYTLWNKELEKDTTGWSSAYPNVIAAGPMIILNGKNLIGWSDINKSELTEEQKHDTYAPRTAIGSKTNGNIILLVIDGRRRNFYGISFEEMAIIGRWLNLQNLLNLDGGGSSTIYYKQKKLNSPSDGCGIIHIERKVANALLIIPK